MCQISNKLITFSICWIFLENAVLSIKIFLTTKIDDGIEKYGVADSSFDFTSDRTILQYGNLFDGDDKRGNIV